MSEVIGILAPFGRDAAVISDILGRSGIQSIIYDDIAAFTSIHSKDVGTAIISEEALGSGEFEDLTAWLHRQPPWSDLPIILLTKRSGSMSQHIDFVEGLGNVTLIERPFHPVTLVSAARSALRARRRQREAERFIEEIDDNRRALVAERALLAKSEERLRVANETLGQRFAEALAERRILADIVERSSAFVQVVDLGYHWIAINRASKNEFERLFGVRPEVGQSTLDVLPHMPDHRKALQTVWGRALAGEEFVEILELGSSEGGRRFHEMRFNTLRNERGEPIGAYQFAYDITDRVEAQSQLAEAQARVHEMAKMETLGQLTGGVAHDFNNLLTPIFGALDLLKRRGIEDQRTARLVSGAFEAAQRASVLVQRLLSFARRQKLEARAVNIGDLVHGMSDLIQRSIGSHMLLFLDVEDNLPAATIDPNQLELAVLNLAVNAKDAMDGGGSLTISVSHHELVEGNDGLKPGSYVKLAVSDTGCGMDDATLARSIEPFYTTKGAGKGTGLGLSMVHGLAAQSGGALRLRSKPGEGTTAEIWLPASKGQAERILVRDSDIPDQPRRAIILLVDDEELVRAATGEMLREMGHEVVEASSPTLALDLLRERSDIEILISDYLMPVMKGSELVRRAQAIRPDVKPILITGYAKDTGELDPTLPRLSKPFRATDLGQELAKLLTEPPRIIELTSRRG